MATTITQVLDAKVLDDVVRWYFVGCTVEPV
jgi:hypothetical protein